MWIPYKNPWTDRYKNSPLVPLFHIYQNLHSIRIVVDAAIGGHEARLVLSRCTPIVRRWHVGLVSHDVCSVVARNSGVVRGPLLHVLWVYVNTEPVIIYIEI